MDFSIIIATFDRADALDRLLGGIAEHFVKSSFDFEVLIANNARDEVVAQDIDGVIARYADAMPERFRRIREMPRHAGQNRAIAEPKPLVFSTTMLSDTDWLRVAVTFFATNRTLTSCGPILMPPNFAMMRNLFA
jgi:hypothetical protein